MACDRLLRFSCSHFLRRWLTRSAQEDSFPPGRAFSNPLIGPSASLEAGEKCVLCTSLSAMRRQRLCRFEMVGRYCPESAKVTYADTQNSIVTEGLRLRAIHGSKRQNSLHHIEYQLSKIHLMSIEVQLSAKDGVHQFSTPGRHDRQQ